MQLKLSYFQCTALGLESIATEMVTSADGEVITLTDDERRIIDIIYTSSYVSGDEFNRLTSEFNDLSQRVDLTKLVVSKLLNFDDGNSKRVTIKPSPIIDALLEKKSTKQDTAAKQSITSRQKNTTKNTTNTKKGRAQTFKSAKVSQSASGMAVPPELQVAAGIFLNT